MQATCWQPADYIPAPCYPNAGFEYPNLAFKQNYPPLSSCFHLVPPQQSYKEHSLIKTLKEYHSFPLLALPFILGFTKGSIRQKTFAALRACENYQNLKNYWD